MQEHKIISVRYVDANVFLRYFTEDDPQKASDVERLLKKVETGDECLFLPILVFADIVWIMEKYYQMPRHIIRQTLESILTLQGIICDDKEILYDTLALYEEKNIDLTDSMVIAQMRYSGVKEIFTYDKDFDNQENIIRLEPPACDQQT